MSYSSLWVMDKNYYGSEITEYGNSWLFSPIAWDVLLDKYMKKEIQTPYSYKKSIIGPGSAELSRQLNAIINDCEELYDRIVWEISNQQIFFAKDKKIVADGIRSFLKSNAKYDRADEGSFPLEQQHIRDRWLKIADDIENISDDCKYFIFKNTSVDDGVEYWFEKFNEESDEYEQSSLKELDELVSEFVFIENGKMQFKSNIEYFKEVSDHEA